MAENTVKWLFLVLTSCLSFVFVVSESNSLTKKTYIVQMHKSAMPASFATPLEWYSSKLKSVMSKTQSGGDGDRIIYSYQNAFHGVAAQLTEEEAERLKEEDGVVAILPEKKFQLHTTRSPMFLGLEPEETGNGGPDPVSLTNVSPWITTVGASTMDRDFSASVKLGSGRTIAGVSLYKGRRFLQANRQYPLVYMGSNSSSPDPSSLCLEGTLDPHIVSGKIVICDRGISPRVQKGQVVKDAGGVGMILTNTAANGEELVADCHLLPAVAVGEMEGKAIKHYASTNRKATATLAFLGTTLGVKPSPVVAAFSSRGPNFLTLEILKPDVIAPGKLTAIQLKAFSKYSNMTCQHKLASPGDLNYPAISVVFPEDTVISTLTLHRTATNVGPPNSSYHVVVSPFKGVTVKVEPNSLKFTRRNQKLSYKISFTRRSPQTMPEFGGLVWKDGVHKVRSPIVITWLAPL
ncbi:hypothetical protein V6N11_068030 [Hibiscus sabdariffa]|uniref:Uncharacterized protein n=1 Tax=Hibiscus sabdariffa TaxID=183260 RepID=A0ABR2ST59_9ROSI